MSRVASTEAPVAPVASLASLAPLASRALNAAPAAATGPEAAQKPTTASRPESGPPCATSRAGAPGRAQTCFRRPPSRPAPLRVRGERRASSRASSACRGSAGVSDGSKLLHAELVADGAEASRTRHRHEASESSRRAFYVRIADKPLAYQPDPGDYARRVKNQANQEGDQAWHWRMRGLDLERQAGEVWARITALRAELGGSV